ncbi:MAG: hypothetical protein ACTSQA_02710 [Candidatus Heimdallarchaeaceae archaeon]
MKVPLQKYWEVQKKYLAPFKGKLVLLAILLISGTALQIFTPLVIENYIDLATQDTECGKYFSNAHIISINLYCPNAYSAIYSARVCLR